MQQRSPIIFWLLVAATLAVDAAANCWLLSYIVSKDFSLLLFYANTAVDALLTAQVSLVCVWSALSPAKTVWIRIAPWLAVIIAVALFAIDELSWGEDMSLWYRVSQVLCLYLLQTALLIARLWLFERTPFWRKRSNAHVGWRLSLGQLLIITTVVAIFIAAMRETRLMCAEFNTYWVIAWVCSLAVLAMVAVFSWGLSCHWLLRLALVVAAALLFGTALGYFRRISDIQFQSAHFVIQATVLSIWLSIGPILPPPIAAGEHNSQGP